jgi:hypothetical protein
MDRPPKKKKCPFDVIFDILDDWKALSNTDPTGKNRNAPAVRQCGSCGKTIPFKSTSCRYCGKNQATREK